MSWRGAGVARGIVRLAARLVPSDRRDEWRDEWMAELEALDTVSPDARTPDARGPDARTQDTRLPAPWAFAFGAVPDALWTATERWTMDAMIRDLRYAVRTLARTPGFALVAAGTLAVGIGANATIFTLANGLLLRDPAGVEEPDRLVQVARSYDSAPRWDNWSWPAFEVIAGSPAFSGVAGFTDHTVVLGGGVEASLESAMMVSGSYFDVLGVEPLVGRLLGPSDDVTPGAHPVAVLGHGLWSRRYGGAPSVVGSTIQVGGQPYQVVGVAPADFRGTETLGSAPGLFIPTAQHPERFGMLPFGAWGWSWMEVVGRLAPGVSLESARAAMDVVTTRMRDARAENEDIRVLLAEGVGLEPADRAEARTLMLLLAGIAGLVLLLACSNVANLFIARATTRSTEIGVRLALGAGSARLARQLTTEAVVLGVFSAALALPLVTLGARALPQLFPYPLAVTLAPDARVLAALVGLGVLAGLLFGAVPSVALARRDLAGTLRESASTDRGATTRARNALVVGQIAVSLALVAASALLGRSVMNAAAADPGFEPRGLLAASVDIGPTGRYEDAAAVDFFETLQAEAARLPGVRSATIASQGPFLGGYARASAWPEGSSVEEGPSVEAEAIFVGADYLETMGIRLVEGRTLRASSGEPEPVALVNEALARLFWPGESAVGKRLGRGADSAFTRVVGVVADVQNRSLRATPAPAVYRPLGDSFGQAAVLHLRVAGEPMSFAGAARELVADLDPGVPVGRVADVHARMAASLGTTRTLGLLAATFAGVALALSALGLYGLVSYGVSRRRRELGIRLALGSRPRDLVGLVLRGALGLALAGVVAGSVLGVLAGRVLRDVLFGVEPGSPGLIAGAAVLLVAVSLLAAWIPALRASRADAVLSLRDA